METARSKIELKGIPLGWLIMVSFGQIMGYRVEQIDVICSFLNHVVLTTNHNASQVSCMLCHQPSQVTVNIICCNVE